MDRSRVTVVGAVEAKQTMVDPVIIDKIMEVKLAPITTIRVVRTTEFRAVRTSEIQILTKAKAVVRFMGISLVRIMEARVLRTRVVSHRIVVEDLTVAAMTSSMPLQVLTVPRMEVSDAFQNVSPKKATG